MKKLIIVFFFLTIVFCSINNKENILIPKDAIRFRIIANSDSFEDQKLKLEVKNDIEKELYNLVNNATNTTEARSIIKNNIPVINTIVNKYNVDYDITYGNNYFPQKEYKGILYASGNYESLVIKLGNAVGKNWWCVLFPPLCMLDNDKSLTDKEYRFFVKDIINQI